nr:vesicle-associated protein 1-3 [Ipomoea batatas]
MISRLTEEKGSAVQQNQKLSQELEAVRKELNKSKAGNFSVLFVVLVGLLGILLGYFMRKR